MKTKYRMINLSAFLRLLLVGGVSLGLCYLGGSLLSNILDYVFRDSNRLYWREVFLFLSWSRGLIAMVVFAAGIALFGGWILAPVFNNFSEVVAESLQLSGNDVQAVTLPRGLGKLETRLNDINKELRLWKYQLREAEQRKDDLVVYLAHDIRTPLTSVLGYLGLIVDNPSLRDDDRQKFAAIALRKAERMQLLVEELFEITRFNIGNVELNRREVNASIFINQLAEEFTPLLAERSIRIDFENQGVETLFIDPDKMARAMDNILNNAASYTPAGGQVSILVDRTSGNKTRIQISNTGNEISPEALERLFEKFYRGDEARQSGSGGAGLGLAIAKQLIEAHGGAVTADSQNRMTTFTVLL